MKYFCSTQIHRTSPVTFPRAAHVDREQYSCRTVGESMLLASIGSEVTADTRFPWAHHLPSKAVLCFEGMLNAFWLCIVEI